MLTLFTITEQSVYAQKNCHHIRPLGCIELIEVSYMVLSVLTLFQQKKVQLSKDDDDDDLKEERGER